MTTKKDVVKSKDLDGKVVSVVVKRPSPQQLRESQLEANRTFSAAISSNTILRAKLTDYMKEQGLWSDKKEEELKVLIKRIRDNELVIAKGGIKVSAGKEAAIQIRRDRLEQIEMLYEQRRLDAFTAEGQAENAKFDYLVSTCTLDAKSGKRKFNSLEDYTNNSNQPFAVDSATKLHELLYDVDEKYEETLPENKFLKRFNLVDDELRLINKAGKLVDTENRLIDENDRFITEEGAFCDIEGRLVDETGNPVVEQFAFLDDDGEVIIEECEEVSIQKPNPPKTVKYNKGDKNPDRKDKG